MLIRVSRGIEVVKKRQKEQEKDEGVNNGQLHWRWLFWTCGTTPALVTAVVCTIPLYYVPISGALDKLLLR